MLKKITTWTYTAAVVAIIALPIFPSRPMAICGSLVIIALFLVHLKIKQKHERELEQLEMEITGVLLFIHLGESGHHTEIEDYEGEKRSMLINLLIGIAKKSRNTEIITNCAPFLAETGEAEIDKTLNKNLSTEERENLELLKAFIAAYQLSKTHNYKF